MVKSIWWLIAAMLIAFTFYGSGTGNDRPQIVNRAAKADALIPTFAERFGDWRETPQGSAPLVAQDCDCTTDSDCEEQCGVD